MSFAASNVMRCWQVIQKKRAEKPEVRKASREAALRCALASRPRETPPHRKVVESLTWQLHSLVAESVFHCREVKERMKKAKESKSSVKAPVDTKKTGAKSKSTARPAGKR